MTEPYYTDDQVTLYLGDCLEVDEWLAADVLVTDPPYGMAYQSGKRRVKAADRIAGDDSTDARDAALELWGTGRPALVFGTWRSAPPRGERARLVWWKRGGAGMGDLAMPWGTTHEDIHVMGRGWDRAATGLKRAGSVLVTSGAMGNPYGHVARSGHPTGKPVALLEALVERCPAGVVADPFAGSGSTLIAARNLGRRAVGVEVEERFAEMTATRLAQGALDLASLAESGEAVPLDLAGADA